MFCVCVNVSFDLMCAFRFYVVRQHSRQRRHSHNHRHGHRRCVVPNRSLSVVITAVIWSSNSASTGVPHIGNLSQSIFYCFPWRALPLFRSQSLYNNHT
jgi:hypothetical protein